MTRPLVVTDPGLVAIGLAAMVAGPLGKQATVSFSDVAGQPDRRRRARRPGRYRAGGCDGLVAIGGGSAIDAAKAIRLLVTHPGRLADYDLTRGGQEKITAALPPMVAVPTTAGTGSEVGPRNVDPASSDRSQDGSPLSPYLLPSVAICDPELTTGLSPALTAGTGMDAFTHCVESYLSTTFHPICDGIAVEGLKYISKGLETAVRDGANIEARTAMMMGALLGGISFHKGLGVVHSLSHALGATGRVASWNAQRDPVTPRTPVQPRGRSRSDGRPGRTARARPRRRCGRASDHSDRACAGTIALPRRLGQLEGLKRDRIAEYARLAMLDHCHATNPRPCTQADMEDLLERAW